MFNLYESEFKFTEKGIACTRSTDAAMTQIPWCHLEQPATTGGCVDYNWRMATSPVTGVCIAVLLAGGCRRRLLPLMMLLPYAAGRAATAFSRGPVDQLWVATPLLTVAYFWGHVSFSNKPVRDAVIMFVLTLAGVWASGQAETQGWLDTDLAADAAQVPAFGIALVASWVALARHGAWLWFFGLAWGIAGPTVLIPMLLRQHPYTKLTTGVDAIDRIATGPILWYSDAFITIPLAAAGQIRLAFQQPSAAMESASKRKGD